MKKYLGIIIIASMFTLVSCTKEEPVESAPIEEVEVEEPTVEVVEEPVVEEPKVPTYKTTYLKDFVGYEILISDGDNKEIIKIKDENSLIGFMDREGNILIEPKYEDAYIYGNAISVMGENGYYLVDYNGEVLVDEVNGKKIAHITAIEDDRFIIGLINDDGSYMDKALIIDIEGNVLFETEEGYDIRSFDNEIFYVVPSDVYFGSEEAIMFLTSDGEILTDAEVAELEDELAEANNRNMFVINDTYFIGNDYFAICDSETKEPITEENIIIESLYPVGDNFIAQIHKEDKYDSFIIDKKGNEILNLSEKYAKGYLFYGINNFVIVRIEGDAVIILDENGNLVRETNYLGVRQEGNGTIIARGADLKDGYLNENCEEILEPIYDSVSDIVDNVGLVVKDDKLYKFEIIN